MGNTSGGLDWRKTINFCGAMFAFLVGAGFATGQEIVQYFASYGYQSILVGLTYFTVFVFACYSFALAGNRDKLTQGSEVYKYFCGKYIGTAFDYFAVLFCYMSYVVMLAGAASTLNEQYGVPLAVGAILIALLGGVTVIFGFKSVVNVIGKVGLFLLVFSLFIGIYSLFSAGFGQVREGIELLNSGAVTLKQAGSNPVAAGFSYGGFGILWVGAFMATLGANNRLKEVAVGTGLGILFNVVGDLVLAFALLANVSDIAAAEIPNLILAQNIWRPLGAVLALSIILAIYSTATPLLWTASSRVFGDDNTKFKIIAVVLAALGVVIAVLIPFSTLINYIYVINGYIGALMLIFMIYKLIQIRRGKYPAKAVEAAADKEMRL